MSDRTPEQRAADRREIEKLHPGERFQMMLEASDTPETDAEADLAHNVALDWDSRDSVDEKPVVVHVDFARQLERERNEARKSLYTVREALCDALPDSNHPTLILVFMLTVERNQLRARVAELEGARWEAVHSGGHWWIAEEKTGDLIEMIAGPESEIAQGIAKAHNLALTKKEDQ